MKMEDMSLSGLDNSKLEAIAHEIYTDLVEDACLGLCFEVHRAVKCGYFFLDDTDPDSMKDFEIVDQPGVDIFGQVYNQWKNKECVCPNCSRSIAASRFAPHLEKCLGMGRNSSRIANRRIASSNNMNKSESDQEDNDDINDNDWSYGSEKKAKKRKSDKNPNSPRRSKSLKHKNGEIGGNPDPFKYSNSAGINYETLGPEELRTLLTTQCGVISEHTKKMCTRSLRCPQHTDEQRRSVRVYLLGPSAYKQLRVPQDQEEEAPLGAGERRPGARLQQEEEAQTPRAPHPQHLRRHQLSPAELMVGGTDRQTDTGRGSPSRPGWGSPAIRTQSGYPGRGGWRTWPSLQAGGWGCGAGLGKPPLVPPFLPPPHPGASIYSVT
ncbi:ataxin-7-like protein 3 isoform 1-T3 [Morphnus guianensis]